MRSFDNLADFSNHLADLSERMPRITMNALRPAAMLIQHEAQGMLGTYQEDTLGGPAWAPLSERRRRARLHAGQSENQPLLASRELHDSIAVDVHRTYAVIGSPLDKAVEMERGVASRNVPPRPFLAKAAARKTHEVAGMMAFRVVQVLSGASGLRGIAPNNDKD